MELQRPLNVVEQIHHEDIDLQSPLNVVAQIHHEDIDPHSPLNVDEQIPNVDILIWLVSDPHLQNPDTLF